MSEPIIEVRHLSKSFGTHVVLRDVDFTVNHGDVTCVIGASGSGKSTLLRCINLLETPTHGSVLFHGQDITAKGSDPCAYRAKVGMVFQSFNLFNNMTVLDNCTAGLRYVLHQDKETARKTALSNLEKVGMAPYVNAKPRQLSGGQKQRVAIARALATRPKYLLCDEATSALDPNTTQSILHLLKEINQTLGVTIVVITHEMRVIEQICQRVAVIDQSCIAEIGNVSDVFTHPKSDIAKALILPKSPAENLPPCTGRRLRLVFDGSCSNEPVISRITLECHVPVNILFADTRIVEGSIYGHMVIDLPDDPQQFHDVLRWLDHNHISYLQEDGSHV